MSVQPFVKPTSELDRRSLGKYELLCRLSTGGMSEIFLATQRGLAGFRKIVVLKSILPDIRGEDEFVKMFLEEARTTAAFNHPNIAQVFDLDTDDGTLFLVMEFVQGATLVEMARACRQAKEPIPLGFTLAAVRDTALALHYAHTFTDPRGRKQVVIHRDVAEKNIMVSYEGTTKLLDFGIAKALGRRSGSMTSIGMVKGTSGYMSPEQIRGEPLDPRSDVFALGVVLHECLTGMRLFHGKNAEDGMLAALREEVQPPSRLSPEVNAALDGVTLKALARDRDARFSTSLEFARAIEKACPGQLWHAEQSGELVQRFYNERRQQTRDLVEQAQGGQELTGELKLDRVLAAVRNPPLQSVGPPPPPVNTGEISVVTPALPQPRRKTEAITTAIPPVRAKPGVAPRASGEKPQLTTDPAGLDIRISRAPVQSVGPAPREETEMARGGPPEFSEPPVRTNPGEFPFHDDDDDDPGAKTIPATSLPADMLAQIRANRARLDAKTDAVPVRPPVTEALPPAMAVRHSNVILEPVTSDGRSVTAETQSNGVAPLRQPPPPPPAKLDPFADIVDEPEPGLKTAIGRPFDTHADEDEPDENSFESGDPGRSAVEDDEDDLGPEPNTNTGVVPGRGIGKFIGIGVGLAVFALAGTLFFLRLGPFAEGQVGPRPPQSIPAITPPKPAAGEAKAADVKEPKAKAPEPRPAPPKAEPKPEEPKPAAEAKAPEPKPEPVKPPPPEPKPVEPAPEAKKPEPAKPAPPPRKPVREPPPPRKAKAAPEPKPSNDGPVLLGSLSLVVDPPVHVFFNGKDLGTTPLKANLPVGKQNLKLVPASGPAKTVSVEVKEAGGAVRLDLEDL